MRVSFSVAFALNCFLLIAAGTTVRGRETRADTCPLNMHVGGFESASQSRLATLVRFAHEYKVSFGITSTDGMYEAVEVHAPSGTVRSILKAILGPLSHVSLTCSSSVVVIGATSGSPSWLDRRVLEFKMRRSTFGDANMALCMQVELREDPSHKGFGGDYMGDPGPTVGPFDIRGASVKSLLCRLASAWPGTGWVAGQIPPILRGTIWANRLWTMLPNDDPLLPQERRR